MKDRSKVNYLATLLQRIRTMVETGKNCLNCYLKYLKMLLF